MFHKEGYTIITIPIIISSILSTITIIGLGLGITSYIIIGIMVVLLILVLQFFRNPKRQTSPSIDQIVSPVDGKVVVIEEVFEKEYFKEKRLQVSVFMSPLNVHVTRHPIEGTVKYSKYHPGKFLVAWHPKSSEENERTTVVVSNNKISILYRQIAGFLAKRIVNYAIEDQAVVQGSDSGFIKFGSRVDVFLPIGTKLNVKLNQTVRGGETIIARL